MQRGWGKGGLCLRTVGNQTQPLSLFRTACFIFWTVAVPLKDFHQNLCLKMIYPSHVEGGGSKWQREDQLTALWEMFYVRPKVGRWQGNTEEMLATEYEEGESECLSHRISQGLSIPNKYVS